MLLVFFVVVNRHARFIAGHYEMLQALLYSVEEASIDNRSAGLEACQSHRDRCVQVESMHSELVTNSNDWLAFVVAIVSYQLLVRRQRVPPNSQGNSDYPTCGVCISRRCVVRSHASNTRHSVDVYKLGEEMCSDNLIVVE